MQTAEFWIEKLHLAPHPEGGFYRETYRSASAYPFGHESIFAGERCWATSIFYLLKQGERSRLHRIHSDELWFYHAGAPLTVYVFPETGKPSHFTLGLEPDKGEVLQETVLAESWFGACLESASAEDYALVSCVVAPGFDFRDFAFANRNELLSKFSHHAAIIERLT